jgi:hypothetical protein
MKNMMHLFRFTFTILLLSLTFISCEDLNLKKDVPNCIERKIRQFKKDAVDNPPKQVWEWKVNGTTYYYITGHGADCLHYLYDDNCKVVCAPDGGTFGTGDGKCPKFYPPMVKTLIWEDER